MLTIACGCGVTFYRWVAPVDAVVRSRHAGPTQLKMAPRDSRNLVAALGFLERPPRATELRLLHTWLDTWEGVGLITVGVERFGYRLSLSHIAEGEWRATFSGHPLFAPVGFGVAATPWEATQIAGRAALRRESAA